MKNFWHIFIFLGVLWANQLWGAATDCAYEISECGIENTVQLDPSTTSLSVNCALSTLVDGDDEVNEEDYSPAGHQDSNWVLPQDQLYVNGFTDECSIILFESDSSPPTL